MIQLCPESQSKDPPSAIERNKSAEARPNQGRHELVLAIQQQQEQWETNNHNINIEYLKKIENWEIYW